MGEVRVRGGASRTQSSQASQQSQEATQTQATTQVQATTSQALPHQNSEFSTASPPLPPTQSQTPVPPRPGTPAIYNSPRAAVGSTTSVAQVASSPRALTLADLQPGDVLLKVGVQNAVHKGIKLGQSLQAKSGSEGSSETVHAAIYKGDGHLLEATGAGLSKSPVETGCTYQIYRFNNSDVAGRAVDMAEHHTAMGTDNVVPGYGAYSKSGAMASVFKRQGTSDAAKFWTGDGKSYSEQDKKDFFCSQLVIRAYGEGAATVSGSPPIIPMDGHTRSSPRMLEHMLKNDPAQWTCVGSLSLPSKPE